MNLANHTSVGLDADKETLNMCFYDECVALIPCRGTLDVPALI